MVNGNRYFESRASSGQRTRLKRIKGHLSNKSESDREMGDELYNYASNEVGLYEGQYTSIVKNLRGKKIQGKYSSDAALLAWRNFADTAAEQYKEDFPSSRISPAERSYAADNFRQEFEDEYSDGQYETETFRRFKNEKKMRKKYGTSTQVHNPLNSLSHYKTFNKPFRSINKSINKSIRQTKKQTKKFFRGMKI